MFFITTNLIATPNQRQRTCAEVWFSWRNCGQGVGCMAPYGGASGPPKLQGGAGKNDSQRSCGLCWVAVQCHPGWNCPHLFTLVPFLCRVQESRKLGVMRTVTAPLGSPF